MNISELNLKTLTKSEEGTAVILVPIEDDNDGHTLSRYGFLLVTEELQAQVRQRIQVLKDLLADGGEQDNMVGITYRNAFNFLALQDDAEEGEELHEKLDELTDDGDLSWGDYDYLSGISPEELINLRDETLDLFVRVNVAHMLVRPGIVGSTDILGHYDIEFSGITNTFGAVRIKFEVPAETILEVKL